MDSVGNSADSAGTEENEELDFVREGEVTFGVANLFLRILFAQTIFDF